MSEIQGQDPQILERFAVENSQELSPETREFIIDTTFNWLKEQGIPQAVEAVQNMSDFRKKQEEIIKKERMMKSAGKKESREERLSESLKVYTKVAEEQRNIALALNAMLEVDPDGEFHSKFDNLLLNEKQGDSLARKLNKIEGNTAGEFLLGPISVITLNRLASEARGDISPPSIDDVIAHPELDASYKFDYVQFAGSNKEGKRVINFVQIKTDSSGILDMIEIDGSKNEEEGDYLGVSARDAHRLKGLADRFTRELDDNTVYRAFVVLVPSYDSKHVNNVYGKIQGGNYVEQFRTLAQNTGYFVEGGQDE